MNYQKSPPKEVLEILKIKGVKWIDCDYYAYPQTFSSTSGPCSGIGGCALSTFTVEAYVCDSYGPVVYVCCGMYHFDEKKFKIYKNIKNWLKLKV